VTRLQLLVRAVGVVSVGLGTVGVAAPRALTGAAGVRPAAQDASLPVVVRFAASRQIALGLALLTRRDVDPGRAAGLFLPVTVVDAAAALAGVRAGTLAPRAAVLSAAVLAANVAVRVAAGPARRG
jgi:hypothetical protein